jgi:hypothetical protein
MSMEDILKVLVESRQSGGRPTPTQQDPMTQLVGSLLGGVLQSSGQQGGLPTSGQQAGLNDMMGMLESIMGGGPSGTGQAQVPGINDPLMALLNPFVSQLARKMNIQPEIAMIVVSFVAHKLLAHHPTSGRDSTQFNLDDMLGQMGSGSINQDVLQSSGMVNELSRATGLDQATAARSLDAAFTLFGNQLHGGAVSSSRKVATQSGTTSTGKSIKQTGASKGVKKLKPMKR